MVQGILILIPFALLGFWAWMFSDMTRNEHLPACFITLTNNNDVRTDWMVAFIFLNVFAAMFYYVSVYRQ